MLWVSQLVTLWDCNFLSRASVFDELGTLTKGQFPLPFG